MSDTRLVNEHIITFMCIDYIFKNVIQFLNWDEIRSLRVISLPNLDKFVE